MDSTLGDRLREGLLNRTDEEDEYLTECSSIVFGAARCLGLQMKGLQRKSDTQGCRF